MTPPHELQVIVRLSVERDSLDALPDIAAELEGLSAARLLPFAWSKLTTGSGAKSYTYVCPACGACVIDNEYVDFNRQRHETWHAAVESGR